MFEFLKVFTQFEGKSPSSPSVLFSFSPLNEELSLIAFGYILYINFRFVIVYEELARNARESMMRGGERERAEKSISKFTSTEFNKIISKDRGGRAEGSWAADY